MNDPVSEHLEHHGVKGMHWGVRRKRGSDGRVKGPSRKKKVKTSSVDFKTTKDLRKRAPHTLSNMQLKKVNERMNLEQKFSQGNPTKAKQIKDGANWVAKVATGAAGAAAVRELATNPKYRRSVQKGAKALSFKVSKEGQMLTAVAKGRFG